MEMGRAGSAFLKMARRSRVRHRPCGGRDKHKGNSTLKKKSVYQTFQLWRGKKHRLLYNQVVHIKWGLMLR